MSKNLLIPSCIAAMLLAGGLAGFCTFQYTKDVEAERFYTNEANALQASALNSITLSMRAATDASYIGELQKVSLEVDAAISGLRRGSQKEGIAPLPGAGIGNLDTFEGSWSRVQAAIQQIASSRSNNSGFERQARESSQLATALITQSAEAINRIESSPLVNDRVKAVLTKAQDGVRDGVELLANASNPNSESINMALDASKGYLAALSSVGSLMPRDKALIDPLLNSFRTAQSLSRIALKAMEASSGTVENGPHARAIWAERATLEAAINGLQLAVASLPKSRLVTPLLMMGSVGLALVVMLVGVTLILREAKARTRNAELMGSNIQTSQKERSQELRQLLEEIEAVGQGDLRVEFQTGLGTTNEISTTLNSVFPQFRALVKDVQQTIASLSAASEQTLSMAKNVNRNRQEQDKAIQHIAKLVDELRVFTKSLDDLSSRTKESSQEVASQINAGTNGVQQVHEGVVKLSQSNMNIMHHTKGMTENIQSLERLVDVVRRVANQSSTVAYNAYLVADAITDDDLSKRIRISADAMQNLTNSANEASEQIETSLRGINDAARDTQYVLDASQKEITDLTSRSSNAMSAMKAIRERTTQLAESIINVTEQTSTLIQRSEQVGDTMDSIHHYATEHSAASEQTAAAISNLNKEAQRVGEKMAHFKV